jgi:hypothetical protein
MAPHAAMSRDRHSGNHRHDDAGHRVDDHGHHIDRYGRHTGNWGVFDDGDSEYTGQNYYNYPNVNPQGGYWSNGVWYQYQQNYIVPQQYSQPYVQPQPTYTVRRPPTNAVPGPMQPQPFGNGAAIVLSNPAGSGGAISYLLNGSQYTMRPGEAQSFTFDRRWVIEFSRGPSLPDAKYSLRPGTFAFTVQDGQWSFRETRNAPETAQASAAPAPNPAPVP